MLKSNILLKFSETIYFLGCPLIFPLYKMPFHKTYHFSFTIHSFCSEESGASKAHPSLHLFSFCSYNQKLLNNQKRYITCSLIRFC